MHCEDSLSWSSTASSDSQQWCNIALYPWMIVSVPELCRYQNFLKSSPSDPPGSWQNVLYPWALQIFFFLLFFTQWSSRALMLLKLGKWLPTCLSLFSTSPLGESLFEIDFPMFSLVFHLNLLVLFMPGIYLPLFTMFWWGKAPHVSPNSHYSRRQMWYWTSPDDGSKHIFITSVGYYNTHRQYIPPFL